MADELGRLDVADAVAVITLNRPERLNTWTHELADGLGERSRRRPPTLNPT